AALPTARFPAGDRTVFAGPRGLLLAQNSPPFSSSSPHSASLEAAAACCGRGRRPVQSEEIAEEKSSRSVLLSGGRVRPVLLDKGSAHVAANVASAAVAVRCAAGSKGRRSPLLNPLGVLFG